jgi:hypothetical protein
MKQCLRILKWAACLYGGAVAAMLLTVGPTLFFIGLYAPEKTESLLGVWNLVAGVLGAVMGACVVLRSERKVIR